MSNQNVSKFRYMHLEKIWRSPSTLLLTFLGAGVAFFLAYLPQVVIDLEILPDYPIAPLSITLSVAVILFVSFKTKNFVSTVLVTIIGSLGLVPYSDHSFVAFAEVYMLSLLITTSIFSLAVSRSRLVGTWNKLYYLFFLIYGIWILQLGYYSRLGTNPEGYWGAGIPIGLGGNGGFISQDIPIIDLIFFGLLFIFATVIFLRYRNQISFDPSRAKLVYRFGLFFIVAGQLFALVTIGLWTRVVSYDVMTQIAGNSILLNPLQDLFVKKMSFPVTVSPGNIMLHSLVVATLTSVGLMLKHVGDVGSTLSGIEGDDATVLLVAPLFTMLFIFVGSYPIQNLVFPGGIFIPANLFPVYMTVVWSFFTINQLVAWILLYITSLFKKDN